MKFLNITMQEYGRGEFSIQVRENMTDEDFSIAIAVLVQGFAARSGVKSGQVMRKVYDSLDSVAAYRMVQREA